METLLIVAIVVISIAILAQAIVLVAMYLMSRKMADSVNGLVSESRKLMSPLERVALNLKATSEDMADLGKTARDQGHRLDTMINEIREAVRMEIDDLSRALDESVNEAREAVLRPVHEWSAIARGVAEGVRTFFRRERPAQPGERVA